MRLIARLVLLSLLLTVLSSLTPLLAQAPSDRAADEAAIRKLIAGLSQPGASGFFVKDRIYWPGPLNKSHLRG
jgi:hypothetical protein